MPHFTGAFFWRGQYLPYMYIQHQIKILCLKLCTFAHRFLRILLTGYLLFKDHYLTTDFFN